MSLITSGVQKWKAGNPEGVSCGCLWIQGQELAIHTHTHVRDCNAFDDEGQWPFRSSLRQKGNEYSKRGECEKRNKMNSRVKTKV